ARDLVARAGERVPQHGEVAVALLHLLLQTIDLGAEDVVVLEARRAGLRAENGVEEDHRAETAADRVEEREGEDLEATASRHGRTQSAAASAAQAGGRVGDGDECQRDRKSTRLNSSHVAISYAVFCLKKK